VPKRTDPPIIEIFGDYDHLEARKVHSLEDLKARSYLIWTDAKLIELARAGHLMAGVEVLARAIKHLRRGTVSTSPEIAAWLVALLNRLWNNEREFRRLIAPRPRRGRRPAPPDLADVADREEWIAQILAEVERLRAEPRYKRFTKQLYDDVAKNVHAWPRPHGVGAPTGATIKKWYYAKKET